MPEATDATAKVATTTSKEELTEFLKFLRTEAQAGVASTKALVGEQAPLVVKELIAYERASATAAEVGALLFTIVGWVILRKLVKRGDPFESDSPLPFLGIILSAVSALGGAATFFCGLPYCLKAWFAPRLAVLDYLRGLL